eukprot:3913953-Prymnesium_polylepis.2
MCEVVTASSALAASLLSLSTLSSRSADLRFLLYLACASFVCASRPRIRERSSLSTALSLAISCSGSFVAPSSGAKLATRLVRLIGSADAAWAAPTTGRQSCNSPSAGLSLERAILDLFSVQDASCMTPSWMSRTNSSIPTHNGRWPMMSPEAVSGRYA